MKKLFALLPLTLALCGCSAFAPVVLENSTIAQSQSASFVGAPKKSAVTFPFLGTYTLTCNITANGDYLVLTSPSGNEARVTFAQYDVEYTATTSDGFGTITATRRHPESGSGAYADIALSLRANTDVNDERLNQSFAFMQEDQSYVLGNDVEIEEFNIEYTPEIYLTFSWNRDVVVASTFTFPMVYEVTWEGFGIQEYDSDSWVRENARFSKTFNAIYEDNTEPKLYAFWLDSFYLARQVRMNGDIINQNYVTATDTLDALFGKQVIVSFNVTADADLKVSATPYDPAWDLVYNYNRGYSDGKAEGEKPVSWFKNIFDGMASFFSVQIIPNISLGLIVFSPLLVLAIIVIVRIFKHGG